MSLHGDRLVIGASGNKKASITGGKALTNSGAAYVFVRTPWVFFVYLLYVHLYVRCLSMSFHLLLWFYYPPFSIPVVRFCGPVKANWCPETACRAATSETSWRCMTPPWWWAPRTTLWVCFLCVYVILISLFFQQVVASGNTPAGTTGSAYIFRSEFIHVHFNIHYNLHVVLFMFFFLDFTHGFYLFHFL